jgi:hypothetical protein
MTEFELSDKRMALLGHSGGRFPRGAARPGLDRRVWPLHHEDRTPTHGMNRREASMAAFAKSWRREVTAAEMASCGPV